MTSFAARPLFRIELNNITDSVEIVLDESATEVTFECVNVDPEGYTSEYTGSYLKINQVAPRNPGMDERLKVHARRQARTVAAEKNIVPVRDQRHYPTVNEAAAAPSIIITTPPAHFGIHHCQDVSGTIDGNLHVSAYNRDYVAVAGATDVIVNATANSQVDLTNVKGDLFLGAVDNATVTTDSAPGEIRTDTAENGTIKVV